MNKHLNTRQNTHNKKKDCIKVGAPIANYNHHPAFEVLMYWRLRKHETFLGAPIRNTARVHDGQLSGNMLGFVIAPGLKMK